MTRRLSAVLVSSLLCFAVVGQSPSPEQAAQAKERLQQLQARLKLSPEQIEKLKPIVQQEMGELKAVRDKHSSDTSRRGKMQMARAMKDVQEKYEGQIGPILTSEQNAEWKKIKEERKAEMKQKRGR